jgi:hypothetical protein
VPTSPTFKYRGPDKRCPFPFNRDAATSPGGGYKYVTLTETSGDEGLAEACRLWWLLQEVVFTPTGSSEYPQTPYPPITASFSEVHTANNSVEPVDRVASTDREFLGDSGNSGGGSEDGWSYYAFLRIAYVSSEWRLYYQFSFSARTFVGEYFPGEPDPQPYFFSVYISSSEDDSAGSGTFSLFGYTLNWYGAGYMDGIGEYMPITGGGITATSTFYSLV